MKRVKGNLWFVLVPAGGRNWSTFKCWPPSCPSLTWLVPTPSKGDLYCSHYLLNLCYDSYEVRTSCISACHAFMLFIVVLLVFWMCWLVDTVSPRRAVTFFFFLEFECQNISISNNSNICIVSRLTPRRTSKVGSQWAMFRGLGSTCWSWYTWYRLLASSAPDSG